MPVVVYVRQWCAELWGCISPTGLSCLVVLLACLPWVMDMASSLVPYYQSLQPQLHLAVPL